MRLLHFRHVGGTNKEAETVDENEEGLQDLVNDIIDTFSYTKVRMPFLIFWVFCYCFFLPNLEEHIPQKIGYFIFNPDIE